jgi:glutathione S-transferase
VRLYHVPNTRGSRVIWVLEEIGAPYELVGISREETRQPEHLARHPLGKVPVLDDGQGFVLESSAHCLHIADLNPDAGLIPPLGTHERALVYQWTFFAMAELEPPVLQVLVSRESDPERAEAARETFRATARVVEDALDGHDYLVGDGFGVADVVVGGVLFFARRLELIDGLPNIEAYLARLDERPARVRALDVATA